MHCVLDVYVLLNNSHNKADKQFSKRAGGVNPRGGARTYFGNFFLKTAYN